MSRLDNNIERLMAQRAYLNRAVSMTADVPGPFLELGLGNGRSYDHLREIAPDREIFVFERSPKPHPECMPDPKYLIIGDLKDTLAGATSWLPGWPVLIHSDIGSGDAARNQEIAAWLGTILPALLAQPALVVSDQRLATEELQPLSLAEGITPERYFIYSRR